jgi:hypothetical protein
VVIIGDDSSIHVSASADVPVAHHVEVEDSDLDYSYSGEA